MKSVMTGALARAGRGMNAGRGAPPRAEGGSGAAAGGEDERGGVHAIAVVRELAEVARAGREQEQRGHLPRGAAAAELAGDLVGVTARLDLDAETAADEVDPQARAERDLVAQRHPGRVHGLGDV